MKRMHPNPYDHIRRAERRIWIFLGCAILFVLICLATWYARSYNARVKRYNEWSKTHEYDPDTGRYVRKEGK